MQDFSQLSSKTVTEVLMLEIKMAPAAKAYLISGYPRSMRDVVEYTEKVNNCKFIKKKFHRCLTKFLLDSSDQRCAFNIMATSCSSKTNRLWRQIRSCGFVSCKNGIRELF